MIITTTRLVASKGYHTFQSWLDESVLPLRDTYAELLRRKALVFRTEVDPEFDPGPEKHDFGFSSYDLPGLSAKARAVLVWLRKTGHSGFISHYTSAQLMTEGVKVFQPAARECEALENIDLRIPCELYRQPFDTFVVELPADYSQSHEVPGLDINGTPLKVRPLAIVGHLDPIRRTLMVLVILQTGLVLTVAVNLPAGTELEKRLISVEHVCYDNVLLTDEERELRHRMCRIFINACLLLVDFGCKRTNPPSRRSQRRARKSGGTDPSEIAVYTFDQHIKLFHETREPSVPKGGGGWTVGPHWRRGHRRREQGYREIEARGKEPRRIFIPPVLVNAHLLLGPKSDTRVRIEKKESKNP